MNVAITLVSVILVYVGVALLIDRRHRRRFLRNASRVIDARLHGIREEIRLHSELAEEYEKAVRKNREEDRP